MTAKIWDHASLCKKAVSWLKRGYSAGGPGCPNAYSEVASGSNGGEIVDAIGLKTAEGTETVVIEVKVSRSDFLADKKKPFRQQSELGMGNYRYYMAPEGLINASELPPKWGLLEIGARGKVNVVCGHMKGRKADWHNVSNRDAELGMASILLSKSGDFEYLNGVMRLNARLERKLAEMEAKYKDLWLSSPNGHEALVSSLDALK
jgi:hypothetical protein